MLTLDVDLNDAETMNKLFQAHKFTHILALAAQAGVRYATKDPQSYVKSNIEGFMTLLEAARSVEPKPRIVYASSSSVYGLNTKVGGAPRALAPFQSPSCIAIVSSSLSSLSSSHVCVCGGERVPYVHAASGSRAVVLGGAGGASRNRTGGGVWARCHRIASNSRRVYGMTVKAAGLQRVRRRSRGRRVGWALPQGAREVCASMRTPGS